MDLLFNFIKPSVNIIIDDKIEKPTDLVLNNLTENKQTTTKTKSTKYVNKFIDNNKDKIKQKICCSVCFGSYTYFNKSMHNKTKRHIMFLNKIK